MKNVFGFLVENWEAVAITLTVLINILNAATRHWTKQTGVMKWIAFISESLSIVRSKGTKGGLKLPFVSSVPNEGEGCEKSRVLLPLSIALFASVASCATWQQSAKVGALGVHESIKGLSAMAEPIFREKCESFAVECSKQKDSECQPLRDCQLTRATFNKAAVSIHAGVYAVLGYAAANKETSAFEELAKIRTLTVGIINKLKEAGIL